MDSEFAVRPTRALDVPNLGPLLFRSKVLA